MHLSYQSCDGQHYHEALLLGTCSEEHAMFSLFGCPAQGRVEVDGRLVGIPDLWQDKLLVMLQQNQEFTVANSELVKFHYPFFVARRLPPTKRCVSQAQRIASHETCCPPITRFAFLMLLARTCVLIILYEQQSAFRRFPTFQGLPYQEIFRSLFS